MTLEEFRIKITAFPKLDDQKALLGLYEAMGKLQLAVNKQNHQEISKRLTNILIGIIAAADTFKVEDLDKSLANRLTELQKELS